MENPREIGNVVGRSCLAISMVAFGVQHLIYGDFVTRVVPRLPAWIPGHPFLAYGCGASLIAAGTYVLLGKMARLAALLLGGTLLASFVLLYLPLAFGDLRNAGLWTNAGKDLALSGGAFLIAGSLPSDLRSSAGWLANLTKALEKFIFLGRYFLGVFLTFCGILHFLYAPFVASLVPAWISGHLFWTYFSGVALIAGGVGIVVPRTARLAAVLSAVMVFLWVVLLHIPRAVANLRDSNETTAVFEAIAVAGTALLVATSQGRTALQRPYKPLPSVGTPKPRQQTIRAAIKCAD
jgi:uncharacterized membrane protein